MPRLAAVGRWPITLTGSSRHTPSDRAISLARSTLCPSARDNWLTASSSWPPRMARHGPLPRQPLESQARPHQSRVCCLPVDLAAARHGQQAEHRGNRRQQGKHDYDCERMVPQAGLVVVPIYTRVRPASRGHSACRRDLTCASIRPANME